jgi:hypothetical protein
MAELYLIPNGPSPTTAAQAVATTGTAIKTMLQVKLGADQKGRAKVVEWGISFDGSAAATPIKCELLTTGAVKATVTEHVASGIINLDPHAEAPTDDNPFAFGAAGDETGYTATAEGTITATRMLDVQLVAPTNQYIKQWPLGREPEFDPDEFLRVRVTAAAAVNCYCYVIIEV